MKFISLFLALIFLSSCSSMVDDSGLEFHEYKYSKLSAWNSANIKKGFKAFQETCKNIETKRVKSQRVFYENMNLWRSKCKQALSINPNSNQARGFFENSFTPHLVTYNGKAKGKFTGYFEKAS